MRQPRQSAHSLAPWGKMRSGSDRRVAMTSRECAEAFKRDIPDARVTFLDTGHFALETHAAEVAAEIRAFLA